MKFNDLVKEIRKYESDTFSAHSSKITIKEARIIADRLIEYWLEDHLEQRLFLLNRRSKK